MASTTIDMARTAATAGSRLGIQARVGSGQPVPQGQLVQFVLDADILLACEDQARSQGFSFETWLQQTANDALKAYLGV